MAEEFIDPLRRKAVAATPEEKVRQWFIAQLRDCCHVPQTLMGSEVPFSLGRKSFRADIVVYDRALKPLAVVECKRESVALTREVLDQALRYDLVLDVKYLFITNGKRTFAFVRGPVGFTVLDHFPDYEEMLCRR